jgi:hypothetical protein
MINLTLGFVNDGRLSAVERSRASEAPHTLKHRSHLAMRGAAPRAMQELGADRDLAHDAVPAREPRRHAVLLSC